MTHTQKVKTYPYKPKIFRSFLCIIFFGFATWFLINQALTNERGLTLAIYRLIELPLTSTEASLWYWFLTAISLGITLLGLIMLYKSLASDSVIEITSTGIKAPKGFFSIHQMITVPYKDIIALEHQKVNGIRSLKIIHSQGKLYISETMLPQKQLFDEIADTIYSHIQPH